MDAGCTLPFGRRRRRHPGPSERVGPAPDNAHFLFPLSVPGGVACAVAGPGSGLPLCFSEELLAADNLHGVNPARKRWGQHFLASGRTAERIVEAAALRPTDTVIEVGPGEGALTRPLAARVSRLLAIEIDPRRARALSAEF